MFWQHQALQDVLFLMVAFSSGIMVVLYTTVPRLFGLIWRVYGHQSSENIRLYIARFMPLYIFTPLVLLSCALSLLVIGISYGVKMGWISQAISAGALGLVVAYPIIGFIFLSLVRWSNHLLWRRTFMEAEEGEHLAIDYIVILSESALFLLPFAVLSLSPVPMELYIYGSLIVLLVGQVLRWVQAMRRLNGSGGRYIYIFLYLCTQEILPWVYVGVFAWLNYTGKLSLVVEQFNR